MVLLTLGRLHLASPPGQAVSFWSVVCHRLLFISRVNQCDRVTFAQILLSHCSSRLEYSNCGTWMVQSSVLSNLVPELHTSSPRQIKRQSCSCQLLTPAQLSSQSPYGKPRRAVESSCRTWPL